MKIIIKELPGEDPGSGKDKKMLDALIVGGAIITGLAFIARAIIAWKKLDEMEKKEDEEHNRSN